MSNYNPNARERYGTELFRMLPDMPNRYSHIAPTDTPVLTIESADDMKTALGKIVNVLQNQGLLEESVTLETLLRSPIQLSRAIRDVRVLETMGIVSIENSFGSPVEGDDPLGVCARSRTEVERLLVEKSYRGIDFADTGDIKVLTTDHVEAYVTLPRPFGASADEVINPTIRLRLREDASDAIFAALRLTDGTSSSSDALIDSRSNNEIVLDSNHIVYKTFNGDCERIAMFVEKYLVEHFNVGKTYHLKPVDTEARILFERMHAAYIAASHDATE